MESIVVKLTTLAAAMTGRASPAKAAVGDKPVFAYTALPGFGGKKP